MHMQQHHVERRRTLSVNGHALCEKYGPDYTLWPAIGCGARFSPFKRGQSQVAEFKLEDGSWTAFSAERMPQEFDDDIKKVHAEFFRASTFLKPDDLQYIIPITFPMSHIVAGAVFVGIAKYPVDEWIASGEPKITSAGWAKLCMKIATKDTVNLNGILTLSEKILSKM